MQWLRAAGREIYGLFVDDGTFALGIVVWLAVVVAGVSRVAWNARWGGIVLFAGLALLLIENVMRGARRPRE